MAILWVASLTALGLPLRVLLPQQVTLLNTLTIGVPALFIMFGRGGAAAARGSFVREIGVFALRTGAVIGAAGLVVALLAKHVWGADGEGAQRTYLLTTLVLLGLDALLRVLADSVRASSQDRHLRLLAAVAVPVYLLAMYVPWAAEFFNLTPLALTQWAQVIGIVAPAAALGRVSDRLSSPSGNGGDI